MSETDSMVAGAELAARIAVEVMEWQQKRLGTRNEPHWVSEAAGVHAAVDFWRPDIHWSAAGEVLERMKVLRWTYFQLEYRRAQAWYAEFERESETGLDTYREYNQPTGPLAICLAALAAVRSAATPST